MPINNLYGGLLDLASRALEVRNEKQGLIQSNVANQETPGYKVQDFSFQRVMEDMMTGKGKLDRTHPRHMALDPVQTSESMEYFEEDRPVDLDEEMLKLSENQLMYQVTTRIVTKNFDGLKYAIDEGGR